MLTVVAIAAADVARPARALNALRGVALMFAPLLFDSDKLQSAVTLGLGIALLLSVRRGPILERYGAWHRLLVWHADNWGQGGPTNRREAGRRATRRADH